MQACTIIARNYLAHARVLASSLAEHDPNGSLHVLILDSDVSDVSGEGFNVLSPKDIMTSEEYNDLRAIYSVMELATAVKPKLLSYLLRTGDHAIYFDPDILVLDSLSDLENLARTHGIALTPHSLQAIPRDGRNPSETDILQAGVYNLGFVACGSSATEFLDWWWDRLKIDCVVAPQEGYFVDQRWVDFAPSLFDHIILKDPGLNVAYWNIANRKIESTTTGSYAIDGQPIRFFHFSGYNPSVPHLLSKHQGELPRVLLSEQPYLAELCSEYGRLLLGAGYQECQRLRLDLDVVADGVRLDRHMRRLYRSAVKDTMDPTGSGRKAPPNPFEDPENFIAWLSSSDDPSFPQWHGRYLQAILEGRPDVRSAIADVRADDGASFLGWLAQSGATEESVPTALLPNETGIARPSKISPAVLGQGVNVIGYLRAELGVGEAARNMVDLLSATEEKIATVTYGATVSRQDHPFVDRTPEPGVRTPYDINLICVNADQMPTLLDRFPELRESTRRNIGYWAWELDEFPEMWQAAAADLDEVWMFSEYSAAGLRKVIQKPVTSVPIPIVAPPPGHFDRAAWGIPTGFMFLFIFDHLSVFERKNPLAIIEAFTRAFTEGAGPILVIKTINSDRKLKDAERLRLAAQRRSDIFLLDRYLSPFEKNGLMADCDSYVSLHRAEGFGITLAEAMALGKPTIGTGYSGNLAFMNHDNSYLVAWVPGSVPAGCEPYPKGAAWAEPDVDDAARLMRQVFEDPGRAREIGHRARLDIERYHSPAARTEEIRSHLDRIRSTPSSRIAVRHMMPLSGASDPHSHATALISSPLSVQWARGGSRLTRMVRDILGRLLEPLMSRLSDRDQAMFAYAESLNHRLMALDARTLENSGIRDQFREYSVKLLDEVSKLDDRLFALDSSVAADHRHILRRQDSIEGTQRSVEAFLAEWGGDLRQDWEGLARKIQLIESQLWARPYMSEPDTFFFNEGSIPTLGFRSVSVSDSGYLGFEDLFRGPEEMVRDRLRVYLERVTASQPVVDLGCGRGEFLDLARQAGVVARGVDLDKTMVQRCSEKGHDATEGDALHYLASCANGSLGTVFSAQFIEHIAPADLWTLLRVSLEKIQPGGLFIAETVNPHCVSAFRTFWTDLSHQAPIFPEVLLAMGHICGFASGEVVFPETSGDLDDDLRLQGSYAVVLRTPNT